MHSSFTQLIQRFHNGPLTRILAFGSSNTERAAHCEGGHNWFDWLDVALQARFGRVHHSLNVGISGETTRELLGRFERDVAFYQPHAVVVTIGGNDSNPDRAMDATEFRANLDEIVARLQKLPDCVPILQTYYSFDGEKIHPQHAAQFLEYMQIVRECATRRDVPLMDNLPRWEALRSHDVAAFRVLMRDPCHVNRLGHAVWGLDVCRAFGAPPSVEAFPMLAPALAVQRRFDELAG